MIWPEKYAFTCLLPKCLTQSLALPGFHINLMAALANTFFVLKIWLGFCGEDNQAGIKCPVGKLPWVSWSATSSIRPLCQQRCNPLQPLGCVVSWSSRPRGKYGLMGELFHCSQRNISLLSNRGLHYHSALLVSITANVRSSVLDLFYSCFCSLVFTVFMYFARCNLHWLQPSDFILHLIGTVQLY